MFAPYASRRKVSVFGSARTPREDPAWKQAYSFAARMTELGWMTITGAGEGIMGAAQAGAGREASFGVNIRLPFEQQANEVIAGDPKLINFRYFFTRKVCLVKYSCAFIVMPGGLGTLDELFEAATLIQCRKIGPFPLVLVGDEFWSGLREFVWSLVLAGALTEREFGFATITNSPRDAVDRVLNGLPAAVRERLKPIGSGGI